MTDVLTRRLALRVWVVVGACMLTAVGVGAGAEAGAPGDVTFDVQVTRAEVGRTRVIAFHVEQGTEDRTTEAVVRDKGIVEVIEKPTALAGCTTGYMRIRGLKAGTTMLAIGAAKLKVDVVKARAPELRPETQIIEPASGAVVWGEFAVGVEVDQSGVRTGEDPKIELRLSTGQKLEPVGVTPLTLGPVRRVNFEVDASTLPAGPLSMWVVEGEEGLDASTYPDAGGEGQRLRVRVVRPESGAVTKIEAEEPFTGERPERFKRPKVTVQNDKDASGGKFVNNASSDPAVCVAFHVDQTGWYQAFVRASGDFGGGAFPTVGLVVDGGQYAATNARLCTKDWHRLALGVPVKLEAGDRVLTPYFLNDFAAGKSDRNLRLDYIELLRVDGPAAGGSEGGGMMEGMTGQAMTGNQPMAADSMMAMSGAGSGDFAMDDPEGIAPGSPLRIGLSRVLDGQVITGDLVVEGFCWFEGMDSNPPVSPPMVTVKVNGEAVSKQWAISPRFEIDAGSFKRGKNTVQLTARLGSGALARTPVQTMTWNPPGTAKTDHRVFERFTVFDPRWEDIRTRIQRDQGRERTSAAFLSNGDAKLDLPEDLVGSFDLLLEARGQDFKGPAVATIRLKQGEEAPALVKEFAVQGRWDTRKVATVDLKKGPKQLSVAFENDAYEEGKGDRNLYVQSVTLRQVDDGSDKTPPAVAILYPENGASCYMADAVVATATDNQSLAWAELLIDDKPTGIHVDTMGGTGRIVFPLPLRSVSPGRHTLSVHAMDGAKNESVSRGIKIRVPEAAPNELSKYDRAVRLLDRFGFGADSESLAAVLIEGEQVWLGDQLSRPFDHPAEATAFGAALARFPNGRGGGDVQRRAILGVLTSPDPARARFVMWTENHFSTWIRKTEGPRKWSEHVAFERLGVAPFEDLLEASSRSPAMLRYLDQENSYATRLNENYAREIMELHCLGVHGGYTQQDVTSLAHLLTGWTVSREGDGRSGGEMSQYIFRFDPTLNDRASIKVIGAEFGAVEREAAYDRVENVLEVLAAHPSTAQFISRKLADHYLACPAPEAVVNDLAKVFQQTNGDMREMLLALAKHPAFWAAESGAPAGAFPAQRLAHPQDFAIRLARVSGHINTNHVYEFLGRTGQNFFDRPTPDGYSELDSDYTDSNAMIQRWKFAQDTTNELVNLVPDAWKKEPVLPTPPPAPKGQPPAKPAPIPPEVDAAWAQQVVDVLAIRLTGRVLSASSNDAAVKMLGAIEGKRAERVQKFAPLMAQLPEAHLR